jgi:hypothetical protein
MPFQNEKSVADRSSPTQLAIALAAVSIAVVGGIALIFATRRSRSNATQYGLDVTNEQATTVGASLEAVESAWVHWCATGNAKLANNYAVRFEPAPGARGTEVHLAGGGSIGSLRKELHRFKQRVETGEIAISDSRDLTRPAQPRDPADVKALAEVLP